jgi:hypothetical protein
MIYLFSLIVHAEPSTALFVDVKGGYFLNIDLHEEWSQAEFRIDNQVGFFAEQDFQQRSFEGTFEIIPDVLHMNMELSKGNIGRQMSLPIPVIYLPHSQPDLSGEQLLTLPDYSFNWHLYKRILKPIHRIFKNE